MANLKPVSEQPERIVLGKTSANTVGALLGLGISGIIACAALGALLEEGAEFSPVMLVIVLVVAIAVLSSLVNALRNTQVLVDANQRLAARTDTILFFPRRRQEMAFNVIRDVYVGRARGAAILGADTAPVWQAQLRAADGATLLLNDRGTRAEMDELARKVAALLNRPVHVEGQGTVAAQPGSATSSYTPSAVVGSLLKNLAAFAQSAAPSPAAYPESTPRLKQEDAERAAQKASKSRRSKPSPADTNTFSATTAPSYPGAPYAQASAELAAQQLAHERYNALNAPPMAYYAPPVLVMPDLPGMLSFAPALDLPAFPPLGAMLQPPATMGAPIQEIQQVQVEVGPTRRGADDALTQYRAARQFHASGRKEDAEQAYWRALSVNPADAAAQNDLGVLYFEHNKVGDAERMFRRAVALDPFAAANRYNLGLTLSRLNQRGEAYEQFKLGERNAATLEERAHFQNALRGMLHAPLLSPQP